MAEVPRALRPGPGLRVANAAFLIFWLILAAFPLVWIIVMSFKLPIDALAANPLEVILGPVTKNVSGGLSIIDIVLGFAILVLVYRAVANWTGPVARVLSFGVSSALGWLLGALAMAGVAFLVIVFAMPIVLVTIEEFVAGIDPLAFLAAPVIGLTAEHYRAVWVDQAFYRNFINSMIVTAGVVTISLTVGTLAAYALARTRSSIAFWLLIAALIFRALPHSVLVTGYLPPFINSRELLMPLWEAPVVGAFFSLFSDAPPTFYGQPLAVIIVLVSINQPFTIWMLRSFFMSIPAELDEAARVDGCSHFQAFRRVIMPVMWPGVITTGLFSFLLAYNDYLVTALLLDAQSMTMVPAITQFFNRETTATDQIEAIAAAVSITAPLFLLVMVFQRQIVSGLTAGAVKG